MTGLSIELRFLVAFIIYCLSLFITTNLFGKMPDLDSIVGLYCIFLSIAVLLWLPKDKKERRR